MDGAERLCYLLYGEEKPEKWLGGSNAKMLHDAADMIEKLIVMRTGYLCEIGGTRCFVVADNVSDAMDCLDRTSNGEDYRMIIHHSIPCVVDA